MRHARVLMHVAVVTGAISFWIPLFCLPPSPRGSPLLHCIFTVRKNVDIELYTDHLAFWIVMEKHVSPTSVLRKHLKQGP